MKILVTFPNTGWVHKHVALAALKLQLDRRYTLTFEFPSATPLENNQHQIIKGFLEKDYDYWLTIDADNPPKNNPLDLVEKGLDIVGFPTPVYHFTEEKKGERPYYYNTYDYNLEEDGYNEHKNTEGLEEVDAIGGGCMLISRKVLETLKAPFLRQYDKDGIVQRGNDMAFCERAREAGFKIHAAYSHPCMHFNEVELSEVIRAFNEIG